MQQNHNNIKYFVLDGMFVTFLSDRLRMWMSGEWVQGYVMCCTVLSDVFNGALGGVRWVRTWACHAIPQYWQIFFGYPSAVCNAQQIASCCSISITAQYRLIKMFVSRTFSLSRTSKLAYQFTKKASTSGKWSLPPPLCKFQIHHRLYFDCAVVCTHKCAVLTGELR